jgi:hypothetical protein
MHMSSCLWRYLQTVEHSACIIETLPRLRWMRMLANQLMIPPRSLLNASIIPSHNEQQRHFCGLEHNNKTSQIRMQYEAEGLTAACSLAATPGKNPLISRKLRQGFLCRRDERSEWHEREPGSACHSSIMYTEETARTYFQGNDCISTTEDLAMPFMRGQDHVAVHHARKHLAGVSLVLNYDQEPLGRRQGLSSGQKTSTVKPKQGISGVCLLEGLTD